MTDSEDLPDFTEAMKTYDGERAEQDLIHQEIADRKSDLRELVNDQRDRVKTAENLVEELEEALETAKSIKRVEETSLDELRDTEVGDFEDINEVELRRDEEDVENLDNPDLVDGKSFQEVHFNAEVFSEAVRDALTR